MGKNKFLVSGNIFSLISISVRKTVHIQINMKTERASTNILLPEVMMIKVRSLYIHTNRFKCVKCLNQEGEKNKLHSSSML